MNAQRRTSIATQLIAVFLVAVALTAAMIGINVTSEYQQARRSAVGEALHEVKAQAHDLQNYFGSQLAPSLRAVGDQPGIRDARPGGCAPAVRSLSALIGGGGVALVRPDGRVMCSSGDYRPVADSGWFAAALKAGFGFGGPFEGSTGKPVIGFVDVVTTSSGRAAVVLEEPSAGAILSAVATHVQLIVFDRATGTVMDALPEKTVVGRVLPAKLRTLHAGRTVTTSGPDGVRSIFAVSDIGGTRWQVLAGVSEHRALSSAVAAFRRNLVLGAAMLVVLLMLGGVVYRRIARPTRQLRSAINELAVADTERIHADVPARAPRELAELGHALRDMADARRRTEKRLASLVRHGSDLVLIVDVAGAITYATPSIESLLGLVAEQVVGTTFLDLVASRDRRAVATLLDRTLGPRSSGARVECVLMSGTRSRDVEAHIQDLVDDPAINGFVITCHDITDRKRAEVELAHAAMHDALTGLPNRALALDRLRQVLARAGRSGTTSAVLFIDLDRFKLVNDSSGHAAGDELLVQVAERLASLTRPGDTLSRFGGDEFVVVCEGLSSIDDAFHVAERILDDLHAPFWMNGQELYVTASIGIAIAEAGDEAADVLRDADAAMYRAKESGRAGWALFDDGMRADVQRRLEVGNKLRHAVSRGGLFLEFQPLVSLTGGDAVGVEALLRWRDGRALLRPDEFIPVAEDTGLIVPIGEWVLRESCRRLAGWQRSPGFPSDARISVNVSARQIVQADFADVVANALDAAEVDPRRLVIEVTESVLMADPDASAETLKRLRSIGVRISVDDFGTGFSSLGYLQRLPIDELKIDRSFLGGVAVGDRSVALLDSIVGLGHAIGLVVVAEGVETADQVRMLEDMGCDLAQGFHFARPMPEPAVLRYLSASRLIAT